MDSEEIESSVRPMTGMDSPLLKRIGAGIVSSVGQALPVPFLGDQVAARCDKFVIETSLSFHGAAIPIEHFKTLYSRGNGWGIPAIAQRVIKLPLQLLIYPVRNIVATATLIRDIPLAIIRCVLLGRTIDRVIAVAFIAHDSVMPAKEREHRMRAILRSFEKAFDAIPWDFAKAVIADTMSQASWWRMTLEQLMKRKSDNDLTVEAALSSDAEMQGEAQNIRKAIEQPGVQQLFVSFDQQFDLHLAAIVNDWSPAETDEQK